MKAIQSGALAKKYAANISVDALSTIVATANDLAIVVDKKGVVHDVASEDNQGILSHAREWIGSAWVDTVTVESRPKIESILRSAAGGKPSRWRQVNHPSKTDDLDIPIMYRAFGIGDPDFRLIMGRDLRPLSALQQQLVDVQQSIERDYSRLYHAETRYRMLFQMASEAILIADTGSGNVVEANPAAARLLSKAANKIIGQSLISLFVKDDSDALTALQARLRAAGKAEEIRSETSGGVPVNLSATFLRREDASLCLLRLHHVGSGQTYELEDNGKSAVLDVIEQSPDSFVVTDMSGRILAVNEAFIELCQVASEIQMLNQPLDQWLGRPGVDVEVLRKNLRQRGEIRHFATRINPEFGAPADVELSAVAVEHAEQPCLGFVIRHVLRRNHATGKHVSQPLGRTLEQMTELVGQVPMKDLVRETTDMIERMCIEAALKLTTNNRASAADMLGLSRQSLYVKLNRYGIGDAEASGDS
ncbi:MAG: transcriptional regulator PpsR [Gammaproteobacteria bacterium]